MGLLDDAIREHLDLKRRRGGDPAEIERLEREALGPVRRGPEAGVRDRRGEGHPAYEEELERDEGFEEETRSEKAAPPTAHAGRDQPSTPDQSRQRDVPPEYQSEASGGAEPPPVQKSPTPHPGGETVEYDVAAEHRSREGEDMLEETPEFLQDAPDHDRLWFEQRPPRDFDFDD